MKKFRLKASLIVNLIIAAMCFANFTNISYADDDGIFRTTPDSKEHQRLKQFKLPPAEAWFIDLEGKKIKGTENQRDR